MYSPAVTENIPSSAITFGKVEIVHSKANIPAKSSSKTERSSMTTFLIAHRNVVSIKD